MTSTFAWLDFSDRDRKRAMDVVDLFREEETRDELGIGVIRDAFADRFFPGTSTIQTRVRYFLFIPWLFRRLNATDAAENRFAGRVRQQQDKLRASLVKGGATLGVIGFRAGRSVQRLPSSVYWQGLRRWGLLRFLGSEDDYRRELARPGFGTPIARNDDEDPIEDPGTGLWDSQIPDPPSTWLDATTFELSAEEANYLTLRLNMAAADSLLSYLLQHGLDPNNTSFAWELVEPRSLPSPLNEELTHARNFSESMHGAALLYNLMLAEEKQTKDRAQFYRTSLAEWWTKLRRRAKELRDWRHAEFWATLAVWQVRVTPASRDFVQVWLDALGQAARVEDVLGDRDLRDLIRSREMLLKGPRARLGNSRAVDSWRGASGTAQLDYRWKRPVAAMLRDMIRGRGKRA